MKERGFRYSGVRSNGYYFLTIGSIGNTAGTSVIIIRTIEFAITRFAITRLHSYQTRPILLAGIASGKHTRGREQLELESRSLSTYQEQESGPMGREQP